MKAALELTVTAQLHEHGLIERKTNEIQGLRDGWTASIFSIGHGRRVIGLGLSAGPHTQNQRALGDT